MPQDPNKNKTIQEEAGLDPEQWQPVDAAPIQPGVNNGGAPPSPSGRDPYTSGPLPPNFGLQTDLVKTDFGPNIPQHRLMPIPNNAALGAAVRSTVEKVIQNTTIVQDIVQSTPTTSAPTAQPFDISQNLANTQYVDEETFYGVGVAGFRDDFISFTEGVTILSNGVSLQGDTSWVADPNQPSGISILVVSPKSAPFTNPGIANFFLSSNGTVANAGVVLFKGTPSFGNLGFLGASANWQADIIVRVPTPGQANFCFRAGFSGDFSVLRDPPTDGAWVRFDTAAGDTNFTWETRVSSVSTTSVQNSIPLDTAFHHFRIRSIIAGTILFSVDGGAETAIPANISGNGVYPYIQLFNRAVSSSVQLDLDFFSYIARTGRT